jgi:hypothetical protein
VDQVVEVVTSLQKVDREHKAQVDQQLATDSQVEEVVKHGPVPAVAVLVVLVLVLAASCDTKTHVKAIYLVVKHQLHYPAGGLPPIQDRAVFMKAPPQEAVQV